MPHLALPGTPLTISLLGLGTVKFGRNQGVKYPTTFELPDDKVLADLLSLARDLGVNLLDTAPAYGISEERLGKLLVGQRPQWIVSTKTGEEFENGQSRFDFSAKHTRASVERSLKRLRTDWLDLVLIHSNGDDLVVLQETDVVSTLQTLKQEGKVRAIGFSGKTVEGGIKALQSLDVAMVTYNQAETQEEAVIRYAHAHQKGIFIKKAFASGHSLNGAAETSVTAALKHILAVPGVSSIIAGTINPRHLQDNAASLVAAWQAGRNT